MARRTEILAETADKGRALIQEWLARNPDLLQGSADPDPLHLGPLFGELGARFLSDPAALAHAQTKFWQDYAELWGRTIKRMAGEEVAPVVAPPRGDRRFRHPAWSQQPLFDFLKQSYLLTTRAWEQTIDEIEGLDEHERERARFFVRQWLDAMSPSNSPFTNPEVLEETVKTGGENFLKGLKNLLADLERGGGRLIHRMTDERAFSLGENIAATPGKVVYRNELFELIQYAPATDTVFARPLLIYPPWINKYYILDLTPEKSFVKWCVEQGLTVFIVSWVNPDERYRDKGLDDYLAQGQLEALRVVREITGEKQVNLIGYCVAGTLLAATLAWLEANERAEEVASATFFTAQVDFSKAGELSLFVDEEQLESLTRRMEEKGYLDAEAMFTTFNMLRANDLIWSFVVNNYLLGREPMPFDLLYWNSDSTNLPARLHREYLEHMYLKNELVQPGALTIAGTPIDLSRIRTSAYIQAGSEDHIAPPQSVYRMTRILSGPKRFVLAGSGHIAGVVNPPSANKYGYRTRRGRLPQDFARFLEGAVEHTGSWWPDWFSWLKKHAGGQVPAREPGSRDFPPIEDAPGSYVRIRAL
ncbi:MAG: class I poly(R)-hydroxyalkanoic acid synthase [Alphaproteobacteria bacterium]|nr:MAG: class I poly(R)-hydroxyalkanoic acid synthase [Alphaproteobacteria bacterium]